MQLPPPPFCALPVQYVLVYSIPSCLLPVCGGVYLSVCCQYVWGEYQAAYCLYRYVGSITSCPLPVGFGCIPSCILPVCVGYLPTCLLTVCEGCIPSCLLPVCEGCIFSCLPSVCVGCIPSCLLPVCVGSIPSCLLPVCVGCIPSCLLLYVWGVYTKLSIACIRPPPFP